MNLAQSISSFFQVLPAFKGKRRVCRQVLKLSGLYKRKNLLIRTESGVFTLPNLVEMVSFDLFVNGKYEEGLVRLLVEKIPENGVFVDVGANIGSISIPLARKRPDLKIVAIEASPWIFKVLDGNIKQNGLKNISALNHAAYFESGKEMFIYAPRELFGKGSLNPTFTKEGEAVSTITIDDIRSKFGFSGIDFVKVDVEGFEICVFKGMTGIISQCKPSIVFEFADWTETQAGFRAGDAQTFLISQGYTLTQLNEQFKPISKTLETAILESSGNLLAV